MQTGVIYDERMVDHHCLWDPNHNEKPERFIRIIERCKELKLLNRCHRIPSRKASDRELEKLHNREIIDKLKSTADMTNNSELEDLSSKYDFLYIHPSTYELSLLAAGSSIELISNILDGKIRNGMAIIRPPGHHAMKAEYCGYCFFNNVALAAQEALDRGLQRILIVDWDIHHGQATQQMFYEDPRVLYFSIHGYQNGAFWPHLRESDYHYIGRGAGLGYNVNVPLNVTGMGNQDYLAIFQQLLLPIAHEFIPELILVSAGYDAALGCPEGEMEVTPACYSHFTSSLMGLAGGKIAVFLEGGYCLKSLAESTAMTMRTLLGDPCPAIEPLKKPCDSVKETILSVSYVLRNYWSCLNHYETFYADWKNDIKNMPEKFLPKLVFVGNDEKPEKYPTRGICPAQDPKIAQELDKRLEALIRGTALDVPPIRLGLVYEEDLFDLASYKTTDECRFFSENYGTSNEECLASIELIDAVLNENCRSGIVIANDSSLSKILSKLFEHATRNRRVNRILLLDMTPAPGKLSRNVPYDSRLLSVNLFSDDEELDTVTESNMINVHLPYLEDASVFEALFRFLMPVAYQYNPQLVFLAVSASSNAHLHIIHQLAALARGHIIVLLDQENFRSTLQGLIDTLVGNPLSPPSLPHEDIKIKVQETIHSVIETHEASWGSLAFNVKLPEQNVFVHPWVEDIRHAKYNPEIECFHKY